MEGNQFSYGLVFLGLKLFVLSSFVINFNEKMWLVKKDTYKFFDPAFSSISFIIDVRLAYPTP